MVCFDAGVEVTKANQPFPPPAQSSGGRAGPRKICFSLRQSWSSGRGVDADDDGEFASSERHAEAHQAFVDALRQNGQSSHDVVPDGKGVAGVSSLCSGVGAPEEGVSGTQLLQLALFGETGLAECSDVHLVARQFPEPLASPFVPVGCSSDCLKWDEHSGPPE
ncbi:hypothetical protein SprV_0100381500 [Sparganum proliferum]